MKIGMEAPLPLHQPTSAAAAADSRVAEGQAAAARGLGEGRAEGAPRQRHVGLEGRWHRPGHRAAANRAGPGRPAGLDRGQSRGAGRQGGVRPPVRPGARQEGANRL